MKTVFLDTGYVLALELSNDQSHKAAVEHWRQFAGSPPAMVTTSYVFAEVVTFFNNRGFHEKAAQVGNILLTSHAIQMVHVDEAVFQNAWDYLLQHQDKRYSLADCASFVVMTELGITTAFSFDHHFKQAGFKIEPPAE